MAFRLVRRWLDDDLARSRLFLLAVAALFLLTPIGGATLWNKHEGRFASAALEMIRSGDWVIPRNDGEPVAFYPPLLTWGSALAGILLGGLTEFSARLPAALGSLGCVLLTFEIARRLFDRRTALFSGFILLTTVVWQRYTCACQPDSLMTFFFMAAVWAFLESRQEDVPRWRWTVLLGLALGGAFMTKGPLGVVLAGIVIGGTVLWERRLDQAWKVRPLAVAGIAIAVAVPWFVFAWKAAGAAFISNMWHETSDMAAGGQMLMHKEPFYFYGPRFFITTFPWCVFFIAALIPAGSPRASETPSWRVLAVWIGGITLMFSISQAKRAYYLVPVYPAFAIVTATWWTRAPETISGLAAKVRHKAPWFFLLGAATVALVVVPFLPEKVVTRTGFEGALIPIAAGGLLAIAGLAWLHFRRSPLRSFHALAAFLVVGMGIASNASQWTGEVEDRKAVAFIRQVRSTIGPGDSLFTSGLPPQVNFYLDTPHQRSGEADHLLDPGYAAAGAWLLIDARVWKSHPELQARWKVLCDNGLERDPLLLCRAFDADGGGAGAAEPQRTLIPLKYAVPKDGR